MMRRNRNVINLEAVLIVLPYMALYFLMRRNTLIIQGGEGRVGRSGGARMITDESLLLPHHFLLSFSLHRQDKQTQGGGNRFRGAMVGEAGEGDAPRSSRVTLKHTVRPECEAGPALKFIAKIFQIQQ